MTVDTILNPGLVGSRPYRNSVSTTEDMEAAAAADKKPFDWTKFGQNVSNFLQKGADVIDTLTGEKQSNTSTLPPKPTDPKILGMPATTGAIVIVLAIGVASFFIVRSITKAQKEE